MKFSVLMSIYYKESPLFLREAIESVLNQTVIPNEIVCIKDGPLTEELNLVLYEFDKKYKNMFKFIEFDENKGLGEALRVGVQECSNEIIARMDTDDIAVKERFEKQLKVMEEKNLDLVGSNILEFEEEISNVVAMRNVPNTFVKIKKFAKKRNPFNHMTVMYKKSAVLEAGNYKNFLWFEEYNLWVRMILKGSKMYNIQENLVYARAGKSMFSRRGGTIYIKREIAMQKDMLNLKFINIIRFSLNILTRTTVRMLPNNFRRVVYIKVLRK